LVERNKGAYRELGKTAGAGRPPPSTALRWAAASSSAWPATTERGRCPHAVVGLPEVTLGLLRGAGGVVRLTALIGLEKALPLLLKAGVAPGRKR